MVDTDFKLLLEFDIRQLQEIQTGLKLGLDVSVYAKPGFISQQMVEIREGLEQGGRCIRVCKARV